MKKTRWLSFALALVLALIAAAPVMAEESAGLYALGDKVDDFTVTMSDGQTYSLYELLEEKDAVIINIWATYCGPCRIEFPFMNEAYEQMKDDIEILALSIYPPDTDEAITQYKEELGLSFPMGFDSIDLAGRIPLDGYPTTAVIDRFGTLCFYHTGAITNMQQFQLLFGTFTGDDYESSVLLEEVPSVQVTLQAASDELGKALNAGDGNLTFGYIGIDSDESIWPFVPSEDGSCATASNVDVTNTQANIYAQVDAKAGDVLTYEYRFNGSTYSDRMTVSVAREETDESAMVRLYTGEGGEWIQDGVRFDADGTYAVPFNYIRGLEIGYEPIAQIRNVKLLTGEEAAAWKDPYVQTMPRSLTGAEVSAEWLSQAREVAMLDENGDLAINDAMKIYIVSDEVAQLRVNMGDDIDERSIAMSIGNGETNEYYMSDDMIVDDKGAVVEFEIDDEALFQYVTLADVLTIEPYASYLVFGSEYAANNYVITFMSAMAPEMDLSGYDFFAYADGTPFEGATGRYFGADEAEDGGQVEEAEPEQAVLPSEATYVVNYVDADGNPVSGVMTQVCNDEICAVVVSDENGVASYTGVPYPYEVHVLMVPEGYASFTDIITMDEAGDEITITLVAN
ncbi:MAG: TlpA disulfide reductase family protein [Clostridia bacterium]|nr:TlpA disulfide reductase family protein [Clostridia bacterium]